MPRTGRIVCLLTLWGVLGTCLSADEMPGVRRTEDLVYGRKDGLALTLDLFQPAQPNGCAIIYLVNGGWLSSKDTPLMQNITPDYYRDFLDHGYTVFAIVTSSQPRYAIPDLIQDCQRAVRYVRHVAPRFGVKPNCLGVTGSSSGGHLALCVATMGRPGDPAARDPVDRESSQVQAVACFFPPTDFLNYGGPGLSGVGQGPLQPLRVAFGPRAETEAGRQALGREISPIYFLSDHTPPTLIIHGDADDVVPLQQSQSYQQRAREVGARPVDLIIRQGKPHGWPQGSIVWKSQEDMQEMIRWFDRELGQVER